MNHNQRLQIPTEFETSFFPCAQGLSISAYRSIVILEKLINALQIRFQKTSSLKKVHMREDIVFFLPMVNWYPHFEIESILIEF